VRFTLKPITREDARAISCWRYEGPYAIYDGDPTSVDVLLRPRYFYHSVYDERGDLAGYFCFGEDAQVLTGSRLGVYERESALDIGLGMRPDLTGRGLGEGFVRAGLRFARETYSPPAFRLTVATFNRRAIRVYERAGFETVETFGVPTRGCAKEWLLMKQSAVSQKAESLQSG
jgi:[ribosomal protein S18]-alanine N-acetyltransferase